MHPIETIGKLLKINYHQRVVGTNPEIF